jgi:hypothetical protein
MGVSGPVTYGPVNRRIMRPFGMKTTLVLAASAALVAAFDPATTWWFPPCPFHALTGWLCPLCGSLRAIHAMLQGSPAAALTFNPLTVTGLGAWLVARERTTSFLFSPRGISLLDLRARDRAVAGRARRIPGVRRRSDPHRPNRDRRADVRLRGSLRCRNAVGSPEGLRYQTTA